MYPSNFFIGIEKFLDKIHMLWVHKIPFPCQQDTCVKTEYVAAVGGGGLRCLVFSEPILSLKYHHFLFCGKSLYMLYFGIFPVSEANHFDV